MRVTETPYFMEAQPQANKHLGKAHEPQVRAKVPPADRTGGKRCIGTHLCSIGSLDRGSPDAEPIFFLYRTSLVFARTSLVGLGAYVTITPIQHHTQVM